MSPKHACNAARYLSIFGAGALAVYAFVARGEDDGMDIGSVIDVGVLLAILLTFSVLFARSEARYDCVLRKLQANQWHLQRLEKDLKTAVEAQPSAKAIAGYVGALLASRDSSEEDGAEVVNLWG